MTYYDEFPEPNGIRRIWTADDGCQTSQCQQIITLVQPPPIQAHLDFFPGACPNIFDISQTALSSAPIIAVRVAVLGNDFDVTQVDIGTLAIEHEFLQGTVSIPPEITTVADEGTPFVGNPCECHNLGPDGIDDIVMVYGPLRMINEFNLSQVPNGSVLGFKVTGRLLNGAPFEGHDCLTIINPGH